MRNTEPTPQLAAERYARATALCEWKVRERVRDVRITPLSRPRRADGNHACDSHPYYVRRAWDFFVRELLGAGRHTALTRHTDHLPAEPQPILNVPTEAAIFLVLTVEPRAEVEIGEFLADVSGLKRSVGFRVPEADLTCVVGIGAKLWTSLTGAGPQPSGLHPFRELIGDRHRAVSTSGDLLFHIRAHRFDLCFELAQRLTERLGDSATVVDEVHGFRSFDERDVLGFVDGTENPEGAAASDAVLIGDEDPDFAGGSYVIVQKYVHDLSAWDTLPTEEQELIVGRTKLSDIELPDEDKPPNSHLALNVITGPDGEERQIMRFNMPFGHVGTREFGTYYIAYARTSELIEQMLSNMFIGDPPGNTDRILDFSTALTGSLFFVPSAELLENIGSAETDDAPATVAAPGDGSLGIGGLRDAPP